MRCYVAIPPSYFQIRNFLEIDLDNVGLDGLLGLVPFEKIQSNMLIYITPFSIYHLYFY